MRYYILITAFLEGMTVLVVEIAGARALAPYYGTSLYVWTAQITATLLFLALGYALGGRLARKASAYALPGVFCGGGAWLALFPFWRVEVLGAAAVLPGVGLGSFLAGAFLYGPPLLALGAVSPLLIQRFQKGEAGGEAAGAIFFTNTLGGLAGGWLTALVLVPHCPLRFILAGSGVLLGVLGFLWTRGSARARGIAAAVPLLLCLLFASVPGQPDKFSFGKRSFQILHSQPSAIGLIQVLDLNRESVILLLDGIIQGGMDPGTGLTGFPFSEYMAYLSWRYHPKAKKALVLGLGTGLMSKQLQARGMQVEAVEIEPGITRAAREFFGLPGSVLVHDADARAFLNRKGPGYDLVFLDAYAGENAPWYLMTHEGLSAMKARLNPGGRLVINTLTLSPGGSSGLSRLESALDGLFENAVVFIEPSEGNPGQLATACLVAGEDLSMSAPQGYPGRAHPSITGKYLEIASVGRPARRTTAPDTDELSDLDRADAGLRQEWRRQMMAFLGPHLLGN